MCKSLHGLSPNTRMVWPGWRCSDSRPLASSGSQFADRFSLNQEA